MTNVSKTICLKSLAGSPDGYGTAKVAIAGAADQEVHLNIDFEDAFSPRLHINSVISPELGDMTSEALRMYFDHEAEIHGMVQKELQAAYA